MDNEEGRSVLSSGPTRSSDDFLLWELRTLEHQEAALQEGPLLLSLALVPYEELFLSPACGAHSLHDCA